MRATRQQTHLNKCTAYINRPINLFSSSVQTKLSLKIRSLSSSTIKTLNQTTAMTVYMSNLSLNHYENSYVQAHEHVFHIQYTSSSHLIMTEVLLNEIYQMMKTKIDFMLMNHYLNFFSDESTNIRKKRVINLCVHVSKTTTSNEEEFYLRVKVNMTEIMNARTQAC
jgi:DNA replication protein DnaD